MSNEDAFCDDFDPECRGAMSRKLLREERSGCSGERSRGLNLEVCYQSTELDHGERSRPKKDGDRHVGVYSISKDKKTSTVQE